MSGRAAEIARSSGAPPGRRGGRPAAPRARL